mmetsp:Transcript_39318/g.123112  ORF Transcript_39318/g.123112 Transcript_39318/m.123112 type:complete len:583 (-) Transcript_39318:118-1866(-)
MQRVHAVAAPAPDLILVEVHEDPLVAAELHHLGLERRLLLRRRHVAGARRAVDAEGVRLVAHAEEARAGVLEHRERRLCQAREVDRRPGQREDEREQALGHLRRHRAVLGEQHHGLLEQQAQEDERGVVHVEALEEHAQGDLDLGQVVRRRHAEVDGLEPREDLQAHRRPRGRRQRHLVHEVRDAALQRHVRLRHAQRVDLPEPRAEAAQEGQPAHHADALGHEDDVLVEGRARRQAPALGRQVAQRPRAQRLRGPPREPPAAVRGHAGDLRHALRGAEGRPPLGVAVARLHVLHVGQQVAAVELLIHLVQERLGLGLVEGHAGHVVGHAGAVREHEGKERGDGRRVQRRALQLESRGEGEHGDGVPVHRHAGDLLLGEPVQHLGAVLVVAEPDGLLAAVAHVEVRAHGARLKLPQRRGPVVPGAALLLRVHAELHERRVVVVEVVVHHVLAPVGEVYVPPEPEAQVRVEAGAAGALPQHGEPRRLPARALAHEAHLGDGGPRRVARVVPAAAAPADHDAVGVVLHARQRHARRQLRRLDALPARRNSLAGHIGEHHAELHDVCELRLAAFVPRSPHAAAAA